MDGRPIYIPISCFSYVLTSNDIIRSLIQNGWLIGLGLAPFFMVLFWVGLELQEISMGSFWAVIFHIQAAFGPHLGHIQAKFGHLGHKNTIIRTPNLICSKFIQKLLIIWEGAQIFLNQSSNCLNSGHSGQKNINSGHYGSSMLQPTVGHSHMSIALFREQLDCSLKKVMHSKSLMSCKCSISWDFLGKLFSKYCSLQ